MAKEQHTMTTSGSGVPERPWVWRDHTSRFATDAVGMFVNDQKLLAVWDTFSPEHQQRIMDGIHLMTVDSITASVRERRFGRWSH